MRTPARRWPALLAALLFVAGAQLWLSTPLLPFQPNLGELGGPVGLGLTLLALPLLLHAARRDGRFFVQPRGLAPLLAAAGGLALLAMVGVLVIQGPWAVYRIPVWLNPPEIENRLRAGVWYPLHVLHITGPVFWLASQNLSSRGEGWRWWGVGVLPWLLAMALCGALLQMEPPAYLGRGAEPPRGGWGWG